ncbi:hypothetical protein DENIS_2402 [Desulfonema ishimotonii]|uniref:Uncharacterized protein n=1 Tax=Desulfonema ishimotonii TaxID=45657 RepID=A0A401FWR2_9BACT|nr:hypothetical protein [Desulfonema ishimotonii]GBC61442.1 hypothetical protein DENIS_2402 [Desulfonema ishimotonii]
MKKQFFIFMAFMTVSLMTNFAAAQEVEGYIQGFNCVTTGKSCPAGKEDPVIATERIFVLYIGKNAYYFVPNLDRGIMARHLGKKVRITGDTDPKYKSIKAKSLQVQENGTWKTTWSEEMERDAARALNITGF